VNPVRNPEELADKVLGAIKAVAGLDSAMLHEPTFQGNEWKYLKECLDSTFVSSVGKFVDQFEIELASYTGAKYAVAMVNGSAALHMALLLAGVVRDDEVLIPALTFVATANTVTYCGAIPHFVDSEEQTFGIDIDKLTAYLQANTLQEDGNCINRVTRRVIRAIVPMHVFGHPSNLEGLLKISKDYNIALVEDAAESLGSQYCGRHTGTFGIVGALSFNGNKTITTGGGGALLTNSSELARLAKHLSTTAKIPHQWEYSHDCVAYNYRMPNLNAALGCAQLEILPKLIEAKRKLALEYRNSFSGIEGISFKLEPENCRSNYWLQTIILDSDHANIRDRILEKTNQSGFMTRPVWNLLHKLKQFSNSPKMDLSGAIDLEKTLINIPSSAHLGMGN
jgi:aminotransferase in exopolysaccharide biosynthesis